MALFGPINPEPQQYLLKGMGNVEQLQQEQLKNALLGIQKQYMPQMQEAEIGLKKGQEFENLGRGQNYFAEASIAPNRGRLYDAQAGHFNALTSLAPQELDLKRQQLEQQKNRFGDAYNFSRVVNSLPAEVRAQVISQNPEAFANMVSTFGNAAMQGAYPAQSQNALNAMPPQNGGTPQNALLNPQTSPFAAPTPQQIADLQKTAQMYTNKKLTTGATQRQMEGAIQVESILNDPTIKQQAIDASQYAGAARKGAAALDALSQQNPAAYENYLAFKNQTMVLLQNRIKTLDQMGATDKQREELMGLYNKTMDSLASNPQQFITQFNKLGKTLDTIGRSVQKSASPIANVDRLEGYKPIPEMDGRVTVTSPDGKTGSIPASQLQEALKAGYKEG